MNVLMNITIFFRFQGTIFAYKRKKKKKKKKKKSSKKLLRRTLKMSVKRSFIRGKFPYLIFGVQEIYPKDIPLKSPTSHLLYISEVSHLYVGEDSPMIKN